MESTVDEASELRRLAEWHRGFARVSSGDREWRLKWAAYLERLADQKEREKKQGKSDPLH